MTALLSKEQIQVLNYKEAKAALKLLEKTYDMDTAYHKLPKEVRDLCDDIGNTLLWLEDHLNSLDPKTPDLVPTIVKKEPDPAKAKRKPKKISVQGVVYENVHVAALKTGIKKGTIQTYVRRKPEQYYYVDWLFDMIDDEPSTTY